MARGYTYVCVWTSVLIRLCPNPLLPFPLTTGPFPSLCIPIPFMSRFVISSYRVVSSHPIPFILYCTRANSIPFRAHLYSSTLVPFSTHPISCYPVPSHPLPYHQPPPHYRPTALFSIPIPCVRFKRHLTSCYIHVIFLFTVMPLIPCYSSILFRPRKHT